MKRKRTTRASVLRRISVGVLAAATLLAQTRTGYAAESITTSTGVVEGVILDETNWEGLRVKLVGVNAICTAAPGDPTPNSAAWGYIAGNHALYPHAIRLLTAARLAGRTVSVVSSFDPSASGYCRIIAISAH